MDKALKAFKITLAIPAILFGLFFIYSLFSKFLGMTAFASALFSVILDTVFYFFLFLTVTVLGLISKVATYKRVLYLLLVFVMASIFVITQSPQESVTRFYNEIQNHKMLNNLKTSDVSFIVVDNMFLTQLEQISPIVEALNDSMWYMPNHECRGKEVEMMLVLQTGQVVRLRISRFCDEDAVALLFIKPLASGSASGGNAYVPKLPSTLEGLGYPLSR